MLARFAVAANPNNNVFDEEDIVLAVLAGVSVAVWFVVSYFFLNTLSTALKRCRPKNQLMAPGQVWLNLIPLFNIVWMFITVIRVGDSLRAEFRSLGRRSGDNYGKTLGIVLAGFSVLNCGCYIAGLIPIVLLCVYWSKIAGYSRQLSRYSGGDDDHDDNEDRWEDEYGDDGPDDRRGRRGRRDDVYGDRWEDRGDRHDDYHDDDRHDDDRHDDDRRRR